MVVSQWLWWCDGIKVWKKFRRETESHTMDIFLEKFSCKRKRRQRAQAERLLGQEKLLYLLSMEKFKYFMQRDTEERL